MQVTIIKLDIAIESRGSFFMFQPQEDMDLLRNIIQDNLLPAYQYYPVGREKGEEEDPADLR